MEDARGRIRVVRIEGMQRHGRVLQLHRLLAGGGAAAAAVARAGGCGERL